MHCGIYIWTLLLVPAETEVSSHHGQARFGTCFRLSFSRPNSSISFENIQEEVSFCFYPQSVLACQLTELTSHALKASVRSSISSPTTGKAGRKWTIGSPPLPSLGRTPGSAPQSHERMETLLLLPAAGPVTLKVAVRSLHVSQIWASLSGDWPQEIAVGGDVGDLRLNLPSLQGPWGGLWPEPLVVGAGPSSDLLLWRSRLPCLYHSWPELEGKMQRASGLGVHLKALFRMSMYSNPCQTQGVQIICQLQSDIP